MPDKLTQYLEKIYNFSYASEILEQIKNEDVPITISPEQAKLIQIFLTISNCKTLIEVGTHFGYSTSWFAKIIPRDGKIITIERDVKRFKRAKENLKKFENISIINQDAKEYLSNVNFQVDAIFIDANKAAYPDYLEIAQKIVRKNGLIIADNVLLYGAVFNGDVKHEKFSSKQINKINEYNRKIADEQKFLSTIINIGDGLSIAVKQS